MLSLSAFVAARSAHALRPTQTGRLSVVATAALDSDYTFQDGDRLVGAPDNIRANHPMEPIELITPRLRLRQWRESDREPFAALNADPAVMEFFPSLQSRELSDASIDLWQSQFRSQGWSNWAAELLETGQFIGFVGLTIPRRLLPCSPCVEIGWRLARSAWGHGFASEGGRAALRVAFEGIGLSEVVSFTALGNLRSRAVMERLGLRNALQDFEHPGVPENHALRRHCLYHIGREEWSGTVA
jgi:RimJ/RimL family protein N-acetyltransferase